MPYEGPEPYIFVSYAHANKDKVYPIIKRLHEMGYRLWYDEGIEAGDKWFKVISDHLRRSACMLLFWSPETEKSQWVGKEILIALNKGIRIAGSIFAEATVPDELIDQQMLFYKSYPDEAAYLLKLQKGLPKIAKRPVPKPVPPPSPAPKPIPKPEPKPAPLEDDGTKPFWLDFHFDDSLLGSAPKPAPSPAPKSESKPAPQPSPKSESKPAPPAETESKPFWLDFRFDDNETARSALDAATPSPETDFEWKIKGDAVILKKYKGKARKVVIPNMYQGKSVTKIGKFAFNRREHYITDISIPASITEFDFRAFINYGIDKNSSLTFHCLRGSYAERWARHCPFFTVEYTD